MKTFHISMIAVFNILITCRYSPNNLNQTMSAIITAVEIHTKIYY